MTPSGPGLRRALVAAWKRAKDMGRVEQFLAARQSMTAARATGDRPPTHRPGRRAALAIALFAGSVTAACVLAELALRVTGFRYETFPTVQFGWPAPAVIAQYYLPDRDLFWVPRDYQSTLRAARTSKPAVVFLGDSCTEFGTYPQLVLEQLAKDRPELATGVSLGVAGWSTEQGRAQLERDVLPLRPRVVTIYFGWNDHWIALGRVDHRARPGRSRFGSRGIFAWHSSSPKRGSPSPPRGPSPTGRIA